MAGCHIGRGEVGEDDLGPEPALLAPDALAPGC